VYQPFIESTHKKKELHSSQAKGKKTRKKQLTDEEESTFMEKY